MKKKEIRQAFHDFVVEHEKFPKSLKQLCKKQELDIELVKEKYDSLKEIEADIWLKSWNEVCKALYTSPSFDEFCAKEKILSHFYTWFEFMDSNKVFFKAAMKRGQHECQIHKMKEPMLKAAKSLCNHASDEGSFKQRPFNSSLCHALWPLFNEMLKMWFKTSKCKNKESELERMDAMVEKSMSFFFDMLAPNLFDTFFDMLKHQHGKK